MTLDGAGAPDTRAGEGGERVVPMRLQKFLARAGVASRRGSEDLMTAGRVTVNGAVATELGTKVDPRVDVVEVDGRRVDPSQGSAYLVLNKPKDAITTMDDPQGRPTVVSYVPTERFPGLFRARTLDRDSVAARLRRCLGEWTSAVEIAITEGRKREIKRMLSAIGHPVIELERVSFGPVTAQGLPIGSWRLLTGEEVEELRRLTRGAGARTWRNPGLGA